MKRVVLAALLCVTASAGPAAAETQVYYGFQIGITNAPPPPKIVYKEAPEAVIVPKTEVYVVDRGGNDCDFFRFDKHWYMMAGGFWYRSDSYGGPFVVVDVRKVPEPILVVPSEHWKHHPHGGPPGLAKKSGSASKGKKSKKGH